MIFTLPDDLYQVAPNEVQAQYRDGNIKELIQGIADIKKLYLENAFLSLKNHNLNITTAKGDGLNLWGGLLHFYRFIPTDSSTDDGVQYFNFNNKNFRKLQFLNPNQPDYGVLPDDIFRKFLVLIYQGMFILNTTPNINIFINEIFTEFDKIVVRDTLDMSYQIYAFFGDDFPVWLKWILDNYDILPRPAGVGSKYIEVKPSRRFGFAPTGTTDEWYFKNIGAFHNSSFAPIGDE